MSSGRPDIRGAPARQVQVEGRQRGSRGNGLHGGNPPHDRPGLVRDQRGGAGGRQPTAPLARHLFRAVSSLQRRLSVLLPHHSGPWILDRGAVRFVRLPVDVPGPPSAAAQVPYDDVPPSHRLRNRRGTPEPVLRIRDARYRARDSRGPAGQPRVQGGRDRRRLPDGARPAIRSGDARGAPADEGSRLHQGRSRQPLVGRRAHAQERPAGPHALGRRGAEGHLPQAAPGGSGDPVQRPSVAQAAIL